MKGTWWRILTAVAILGFLAVAQARAVEDSQGRMGVHPAAKVGDEFIGQDELEESLRGQLARLEQQRYELLNQKLEQLIDERLLAREARRRGITVEQLLKEEVYAHVPEVTDAEVATFVTENRGLLLKEDKVELLRKVRGYLGSQKVNQQRDTYVRRLRTQTDVAVYLKEPDSARVRVNPDKGFARGADGAPVTIVEFTDFQCPFCKAAVQTVRQLMEEYQGKVRWVFRDFPISGLHPAAPKAHEAARCAAEQGKFWQYHDLLFERSPRHSSDELKQYAEELQLDSSAFATCLVSDKYQAAVTSDVQEGTRLGVSSTPTFFINGRVLVGAQRLAVFQKLVERELAKEGAH